MRRGRRNHHRQDQYAGWASVRTNYNPLFGATRNAFDTTRSAGARAAVRRWRWPCHAAVADGSDFGGSLRNPAAWNNILWLRPSQGRVPSNPVPDAFMSQLRRTVRCVAPCRGPRPPAFRPGRLECRRPRLSLPSPVRFEDRLDEAAVPARNRWLGDFADILPWKTVGPTLQVGSRLPRRPRLHVEAHGAGFRLRSPCGVPSWCLRQFLDGR